MQSPETAKPAPASSTLSRLQECDLLGCKAIAAALRMYDKAGKPNVKALLGLIYAGHFDGVIDQFGKRYCTTPRRSRARFAGNGGGT